MIIVFAHYRKSQYFKKVSVCFKKKRQKVCDIYPSDISHTVLCRAGYVALNSGEMGECKGGTGEIAFSDFLCGQLKELILK